MSLLFLPRFFAVNSAGTPYPNAKLYTYKATTLNALSTYTSETFGTPHANPIVADANGLFPAIYFDPSLGFDLRLILKDQNGVQIWDEDNIPRAQTSFGSITTSAITATTGTFSGLVQGTQFAAIGTSPYLELYENDAAADSRRVHFYQDASVFGWATKTDAGAAGRDIIKVTRGSSTAITDITFGNGTDFNTHTFNGPVLLAGQTMSATRLRAIASNSIYKSANQSINSSTTLTDDTHLSVTTEVSNVPYAIDALLAFNNASVGGAGFKFTFAGTASLDGSSGLIYNGSVNGSAVASSFIATTTTNTFATISTGSTYDWLRLSGFIIPTSNGTFKLQWAQNTSDAANTTLLRNSYLRIQRL